MKPYKTLRIFPSVWICILLLLLGAASFKGFAQINTNDPTLRLWLKASSLSTNGGNDVYLGNNVTNWADSSTNGLVFVPPPLPPADLGYPSNRCPVLISVSNGGYTFQAVSFRQADDPLNGSGPTAYADRLWQGNDTNADDPTLIYITNDMTLFFVYQNNDPNAVVGPDQCIFAKRGPDIAGGLGCPYEFGFAAAPLEHYDFTYADGNIFDSTNPIPTSPEWGLIEMNVTTNVLTFHEYYASHYGWKTSVTPIVRSDAFPGIPCTFSFHVQGAGGSPSNPWGNGTGERFAGYVAEMALYNRTLSSTEEANIQNQLLLKYFLQPGPPQITAQPTNQTVSESTPASFSVLPNGTPPFTYQWLLNNQPIVGANASTYNLVGAYATNAGTYNVIVSNSISFIESSNAVLTVLTNLSPNLVSALVNYDTQADVIVTFAQAADPVSAANAANYSINNGVTVSSATDITNSLGTVTSVQLTTSGLTVSPSILTVNNVKGLFGGTIPTNSQAVIPIPVAAGTPPTANIVLWLAADEGVYTEPQVYYWTDLSGNNNDVTGPGGAGQPTLQQFAFGNAVHPVVNFPGLVGLTATYAPPLTNLSIYVVGDADTSKQDDSFAGIWTGWGLGMAGSPAGVFWSTYQPNGDNDYQAPVGYPPVGAQLGDRVPALIEGSYVEYGQKALYVNGYQVAYESTNEGIKYGGETLTIGSLAGGGTQPLVGDIAELLIYDNVSSAQDTAVQQYLTKKYFTPSLTLPTLASATLVPDTTTSVSVNFSEVVSPSTATNTANYSINNGVTVSAAVLAGNGTNVLLTTSALTPGGNYVLTVNNVADWAGNAIAANSQIAISSGAVNLQLGIQKEAGQIVLTWSDASATLESASTVQGPWTAVGSATSPYTVPDTSGTLFYKLAP